MGDATITLALGRIEIEREKIPDLLDLVFDLVDEHVVQLLGDVELEALQERVEYVDGMTLSSTPTIEWGVPLEAFADPAEASRVFQAYRQVVESEREAIRTILEAHGVSLAL